MSRPYQLNVLMYEDNPDYQGSFEIQASKENITVKTFDNAEALIIELREKPRGYDFIVLDARAYRFEDHSKGSVTETNLNYIIDEISKVEKEHGVKLHFAINTGWADAKLALTHNVPCPIFSKGGEEEKLLFNHIWEVQQKGPELFVKSEFPEVIHLFDRFFTDTVKEKVKSLYNKYAFNDASLGVRLNNLISLRLINEQIMEVLLDKMHTKTWRSLNCKEGSKSVAIAKYLRENGTISDTLQNLSNNIYYTASEYGNHTEFEVGNDPGFPTHRLIASFAYALLELFKTVNRKLKLK